MGANWHWCLQLWEDLYTVTEKLNLKLIQTYLLKKRSTNNFDLENYSKLEKDVHEGKLVEDLICNNVNTIMTALNASPPSNEQ